MDNYPYMDYTTNSPDYIEPHLQPELANRGKPSTSAYLSIIFYLILIILYLW